MSARPAPICTRLASRSLRRWAVLSATAVALVCAWGTAAEAVKITPNASIKADGSVSVSPAAQRITTATPDGTTLIQPGMTISRTLIILNRTAGQLTTQLATADVVGSNARDVVEIRDGVHLDASGWARLEQPRVTLESGDTAEIKVTIRIPKLVKPGTHAFAVTVTQLPGQAGTTGRAGISATFRQAAIFIIDLPGTAPVSGKITQAHISSASDILRSVAGQRARRSWLYLGEHDLSFALVYRNTGRRLLRTEGKLDVRDVFGRDVARYEVPSLTVYPDGENQTALSLTKLPAFGMVKAQLTLRSEAGVEHRDLGWIVLIPYWLLAVLGALLVVVVIQIIRSRRAWDDTYDWDDEDES